MERPLPEDRAVVAVDAQQGVQAGRSGLPCGRCGRTRGTRGPRPPPKPRASGRRAAPPGNGSGRARGQLDRWKAGCCRERERHEPKGPRPRGGFHQPPRTDHGHPFRMKDAEDFRVVNRPLAATGHQDRVGHVLVQVDCGALPTSAKTRVPSNPAFAAASRTRATSSAWPDWK